MQSSRYSSNRMAPQEPPSAFNKTRPGGLGFGTIPNFVKSVWNNGLFGSGPAPSLFGRRDVPEPAFDPTDAMIYEATREPFPSLSRSDAFPFSPGLMGVNSTQMDAHGPAQWMPPLQPQTPAFDYGVSHAQPGVPLPQVPQLPPFALQQGFMPAPNSMAGNVPMAASLMGQQFSGLSRNSSMEDAMMQSQFNDLNNKRGSLMEMAAGPIASMVRPFVGRGWDGALESLGAISDRPAQRQKQMWDMIGESDSRGMARGKFADEFNRFWDPNSPTNSQKAIDQNLQYQQNYTNAMNASTGQYNAQTSRMHNMNADALAERTQQFAEDRFSRTQDFNEQKFDQEIKKFEQEIRRGDYQDETARMTAETQLYRAISERQKLRDNLAADITDRKMKLITQFGTDSIEDYDVKDPGWDIPAISDLQSKRLPGIARQVRENKAFQQQMQRLKIQQEQERKIAEEQRKAAELAQKWFMPNKNGKAAIDLYKEKYPNDPLDLNSLVGVKKPTQEQAIAELKRRGINK